MQPAAFAPAKINLFLHVAPLAADGYHPLASWMVFADIGDEIAVEDGPPGLTIVGPYADGLSAGSDNLVMKAHDAMVGLAGTDQRFALRLTKNLPPASGIGGGSSDAAATLRLLGGMLGVPDRDQLRLAKPLGADVPACLLRISVGVTGIGDQFVPAPAMPPLHAVLVNPGVGVSTGQVFGVYDRGPPGGDDLPRFPVQFDDARMVAAFLRRQRNDLEAPAREIQPIITGVLAALAAEPETLLARMSGSGATCFALCEDKTAAAHLAQRLAAQRPGWWVQACCLT